MFYHVENGFSEVTKKQINSDMTLAGYVTLEELETLKDKLGVNLITVKECIKTQIQYRCYFDSFDQFSFCVINKLNAKDIYGTRMKVCIYIEANLFLVIYKEENKEWIQSLFQRIMERFDRDKLTLEKVIYAFLEGMIRDDAIAIEHMEFKINVLEDEIVAGHIHHKFNNDMLDMKKRLLLLKNYYDQLATIGEALLGDENELFADCSMRYFKLFVNKVNRLSNNTQILRENMVQLREAHDAYLDIGLNQIMKVFTVVTTIFMPLTLIVGWYGMNFTSMPELTWKYGYIFVIILCIVVFLICILFFKRKKLL